MGSLRRYFFPVGLRRLVKPVSIELKLFARSWLNLLLPHRLYRYRRIIRQPDKKLHLGCGSQLFPGWTNVDMNPKGDLTIDLREGLPFADDSVELIFSEHTLEHFYREHDAPFLLRECLRVLKPGGSMRLTIPDAEAFILYYVGGLEESTAAEIQRSHATFHRTRMDVVNSGFRWKHQHFYMYDEETMRLLLEEIGFVEVCRKDYRLSDIPEFRTLDAEVRRVGTLYIEARKAPRAGHTAEA